jgi:hypothetical protein
LGNYSFGTDENSNFTTMQAIWSLNSTNLATAKKAGAKLVFELSADLNSWMQFAWQSVGHDNWEDDIWWKGKTFNGLTEGIIGATGVTWNSGTKTLTIPLSASSVEDYSSFITQPSLNLILQYGGNINDLGMKSANLVGP